MENEPKHRKKPDWRHDKGFLISGGLCLLAVGTLAVVTFINASPPAKVGSNPNPAAVTTTYAAPTTAVPADNLISGIPDDRTSATAAATKKTAAPTDAQPVDVIPATTAAPTGPPLFILPLTNTVILPYSPTTPVYSQTMNDWRVHLGTDFAGTAGQQVKALADGTVVKVDTDLMWGGILVIDHGNGIQSKYCGVIANVQVGDKVKVNQVIARLDTVPCEASEGPHLHLEMTSAGKQVDPVVTLGRDVKTSAAATAAATKGTTAATLP